MHKFCTNYLYKLKKERKSNFNLELAIEEFIYYHNKKTHSITKYKPINIKETNDVNLIKEVLNNISNALSKEVKRNESDIFEGAYLLISTKLKKNNIFVECKKKGKK